MFNTSVSEFSGLKCRLLNTVPQGQEIRQLVILCHGFGAPGDDLVGLGPEMLRRSPELSQSCQMVFPAAPLDLSHLGMPGSRAWWEINMAALAMMHQTRNFEQLATVTPPGMHEASLQLAEAVKQMQSHFGVEDSATVLGGFSQGAMISTDLVLRHGFVPRQLCIFSGTMICRDDWSELAARHVGCPVYQSHGRTDQILPFSASLTLRDMLTENGFDVTFEEFPGGHTIPPSALTCLTRG
ncbi:MAG: hypothetical protein R3C49_05105 [Planctomycetaceae bacterium]